MNNFTDVLEFGLSLFLGLAVTILLSKISEEVTWIIAGIILVIGSYVIGSLLFKGAKKLFKID